MLSAQLILDLTGNKLEQLLYTALVVLAIDLVRQILAYFDVIVYRKIYLQMMVELRMAVIREALKLEVYEIDKSSAGYSLVDSTWTWARWVPYLANISTRSWVS